MLTAIRPAAAQGRCELINVNSHSLGVVGVEERSQERVNAVLIPRNTPIPARRSSAFQTFVEGQRNVAVPVVEGESERPEFCVPLGRCVVRNCRRDCPKGPESMWPTATWPTDGWRSRHGCPAAGNRPKWRSSAIARPSRGRSPVEREAFGWAAVAVGDPR